MPRWGYFLSTAPVIELVELHEQHGLEFPISGVDLALARAGGE